MDNDAFSTYTTSTHTVSDESQPRVPLRSSPMFVGAVAILALLLLALLLFLLMQSTIISPEIRSITPASWVLV